MMICGFDYELFIYLHLCNCSIYWPSFVKISEANTKITFGFVHEELVDDITCVILLFIWHDNHIKMVDKIIFIDDKKLDFFGMK